MSFALAPLLALYLVCAFLQAVVVTRLLRETTAPGLLVVFLTLVAPLVTLVIIVGLLRDFIGWAVTYKND